MTLPTVFISSSTEGLEIAKAVETQLAGVANAQLWPDRFPLSEGTLSSLLFELKNSDFAVFVLTEDDVLESRHKRSKAARDNVLFELGLFMGGLSRRRTFAICPSGLRIPSDLAGITMATFAPPKLGEELREALKPACDKIRAVLQTAPPCRLEFLGFFGERPLSEDYPAVFLDAEFKTIANSDLCDLRLGNPPKKVRACSSAPLPKGVRNVVPFKELEVIQLLDRLFQSFGGNVRIRADRFGEGDEDLPPQGGLSVGLGFNNLTHKLGELSGLYEIHFRDVVNGFPTDNFEILGQGGQPVRPSVSSGREYALVARVLGKKGAVCTPYLVCAGHTADGTVAACHFIYHQWATIWRKYSDTLSDHHMAIILDFPESSPDVGHNYTPYFTKVSSPRESWFESVNGR